jgi:hypothetical protein
MRGFILCLLATLAAAGETTVAIPAIGIVRDCEGHSRRLFGAHGAFLLGPPEPASKTEQPPDARIDGRTLILLKRDGSEERILLPDSVAEPQHLAEGWVAAPPFLLKLTSGGPKIYRLPMKACGVRSTEAGR